MPRDLAGCPAGFDGTVIAFTGGGAMQERIVSMGLYVGCSVRVIHPCSRRGGPALLAVGDTRLAIGRGMLEKILIASDPE